MYTCLHIFIYMCLYINTPPYIYIYIYIYRRRVRERERERERVHFWTNTFGKGTNFFYPLSYVLNSNSTVL